MTQISPGAGARKRILVIDDHRTVLAVLRHQLGPAGYEVLGVDNAADFLQSLSREPLDLVMVDVSMPVISGEALVRIALRNSLRRCPIVLFSAKTPEELERLARECGADGFICKGLHGAELLAAVEKAMSLVPRESPPQRPPRVSAA